MRLTLVLTQLQRQWLILTEFKTKLRRHFTLCIIMFKPSFGNLALNLSLSCSFKRKMKLSNS